MSDVLRLGIAGLGTVGVGVIKLVAKQRGHTNRARRQRCRCVGCFSPQQKQGSRCRPKPYAWEDDAVSLAARDDVDVYIELIGGDSGMATTVSSRH